MAPPDAKAVQALREAAEALETSLLTAGWTPLPAGSAWYAKRFAWAAEAAAEETPPERSAPPRAAPRSVAPSAERAPLEPVSALPQAAAAPGAGRFERNIDWPPDTEELWRCEIRWHAGYVNSCFDAIAHEPGRKRGTTVGRSAAFKWLMKENPDPRVPSYPAQVRRLADALRAAGWEPCGRGRRWYEIRFLWRSGGAPPDHIELAPAEAGRVKSGDARETA